MSDEFPRPSGDAITDRKRQRAAEAQRQAHSLHRVLADLRDLENGLRNQAMNLLRQMDFESGRLCAAKANGVKAAIEIVQSANSRICATDQPKTNS